MHTALASLPAAPLPLGPAAVLAGALGGVVAPRQVQSRADTPPRPQAAGTRAQHKGQAQSPDLG